MKQDKYCKALEETFQAYERLIADPLGEIEKWRFYGTTGGCRLCRVTDLECSICPISVISTNRNSTCESCGDDHHLGDFYEMCAAVDDLVAATSTEWSDSGLSLMIPRYVLDLKKVARARLRNLIEVAKSKGYEYK